MYEIGYNDASQGWMPLSHNYHYMKGYRAASRVRRVAWLLLAVAIGFAVAVVLT